MSSCRKRTVGLTKTPARGDYIHRLPGFLGPIILTATLMVFAAVLPASAAEKSLLLVKQGESRAPIVIPKKAPPKTREAATELAGYIEKISAAKPRIIEGEPDPLPRQAVWVGYQSTLKELCPSLTFDFKHPEEILIAANENHLVIAGRDRWEKEHLVSEGRNYRIKGKQREYGTANAVYTFIQKYLQVRWLWPGALGEDIVRKNTIVFEPFEYRYHPQIRCRSGLFRLSSLGDSRGHSHAWVRHQRLQLDSLNISSGHGFGDWFDRFHEVHPEYFALQPDGSRSGFPQPNNAKLCQSNPGVWEQWLADVKASRKKRPYQTVFNASPNDSHHSGICICEDCRAWDHPEGEPSVYNWRGMGQKYVAMSDRYITFANHLARRLRQRFPNQNFFVQMLAYGISSPVPADITPADNVIVPYVGHLPLGKQKRRAKDKKAIAGWAEKGAVTAFRPNWWQHIGRLGLPEVALQKTAEDFRFLATNNCIGIVADTCWEQWLTQGPMYYLMARLTWNPSQDGQDILDEYYRRGFGGAAAQIQTYWEMIDDEMAGVEYKIGLDEFRQKYFSDSFVAKAESVLKQAADNVEGEPERYQERVAFVRSGFEHTQLMLEIATLMRHAEEHEGKYLDEVHDKVQAKWDKIEQFKQAYPQAFHLYFLRGQARRSGLIPEEE